MNRRGSRLSASLAAALLAVLVAAVGAGAAGHGKSARQVESFKVVIEGNNTAHRHFYENGEAGTCQVRVKGDFTERTVFLRGKGVTIEIERVRHGSTWQYKIKRIGHGKPDFTVVAKIDREATGLITKEPLKIGLVSLPCPPPTEEDLSKTLGCGTPVTYRSELGFKLQGSEFSLRPVETKLTATVLKSLEACGRVQLTQGVNSPKFSWPDIPDFEFAPLPEEQLFSRAHAVAEALKGVDAVESQVGTPPLVGYVTESGEDHVTVRFVRCGKHPLPACP